MITTLFTLLIISTKIIKPDGIILKSLPKNIEYEDIDPEYKLIYDVMKSIKIEGWKLDTNGISDNSFRLVFTSHDESIIVESMIRFYDDDDVRLSYFSIRNGVTIDNNSTIKNDIILFLWDYIIEYYEEENKKEKILI